MSDNYFMTNFNDSNNSVPPPPPFAPGVPNPYLSQGVPPASPYAPQSGGYAPAPPAAGYSQPYGQQPYGYGQPVNMKTNLFAILSLVGALVLPLAGIILGHISLSQIKKTGEQGRGLALTGLILSYVFVAFGFFFFVLSFMAALADPTSF